MNSLMQGEQVHITVVCVVSKHSNLLLRRIAVTSKFIVVHVYNKRKTEIIVCTNVLVGRVRTIHNIRHEGNRQLKYYLLVT